MSRLGHEQHLVRYYVRSQNLETKASALRILSSAGYCDGKQSGGTMSLLGKTQDSIAPTCSRQYCIRLSRSASRCFPWKKNSPKRVTNIPGSKV